MDDFIIKKKKLLFKCTILCRKSLWEGNTRRNDSWKWVQCPERQLIKSSK